VKTQVCKECGVEKEKVVTNFSRNYHYYHSNDNYIRTCKDCLRKYDKKRREKKQKEAGLVCKECGESLYFSNKSKLCRSCSKLGERHPSYKGGRRTSQGYVLVLHPDAPNRRNGKTNEVLEHRLVMEQHLGRKLKDKENVHHKNGIRDDNRIENLELWSTGQPIGCRVEDRIEWAKTFLTEYGYIVTK